MSRRKGHYPLCEAKDKPVSTTNGMILSGPMCLILFAVQPTEDLQLVVAANRDEFHQRDTRPAGIWSESPNILAGKDLAAGGTWLGVTSSGRFAAVTNFAETPPDPLPPGSRGALTTNFLNSDISSKAYLELIQADDGLYRGYNLLVFDGTEVGYYSNRGGAAQILSPGYYGLSNQLLDCHWPKVNSGRDKLATLGPGFSPQELQALLADRGDSQTPHSARFILGETYGTRAMTLVHLLDEETRFEEIGFGPDGEVTGSYQKTLQRQN